MRLSVDIRKHFKNFTLDVSFTTDAGRTGILGASGCGKSMTLRCIAGIEKPDAGIIEIEDKTVFSSARNINLAPQRREAGYLFQSYALFPTMTVGENIGAVCGRTRREGRARKIREIIERFKLDGLTDRYPAQLSGGQQQRVALARMIASEPRVILLDEPLSALDAFLRRQVEDELSAALASFPGTILFVSHDRDEVFRFCDRIIVLDGGRIAREGTRDEVFNDPRTVPAARLTGCKNVAPAIKTGETRIAIPDWGLILDTERRVPETITHAGIRAHHIRPVESGDARNCFPFSVESRTDTPFSFTEYVTALTAPGVAGEIRSRRDALCRESGERSSAKSPKHLCIPPDKILLLESAENFL